jgi:hypothetical protein
MTLKPLSRNCVEAWSCAAVLAAVSVLVTVVDPHQPGHYPACPFRVITGWSCPGCGSLRALHDLTSGNFPAALNHNAALVIVLLLAVPLWLRGLRRRDSPRRPVPSGRAALVLVSLLLWTVARNLPSLRALLAAP